MTDALDPGDVGAAPPPPPPPADLTPILQDWLAPPQEPHDVAPYDSGQYVPPQLQQPPVAPYVPAEQIYGPLARGYQRGGSQNEVGGQTVIDWQAPDIANVSEAPFADLTPWGQRDVRNPAFDAQQTVDTPPNSRELGIGAKEAGLAARSIFKYDPAVTGPPKGDTGWHPQPTPVLPPLDPIIRAVNAGQSALDLVTIHADKLIPGPGQGTLYDRFQQYQQQGMPADQAANATMRDYGDALKTLAEDPNAPGIARVGAQAARVIGTAQSLTAPAPAPGGTSIIGAGAVLGFLRRAPQGIAKDIAEKIALDAERGVSMDAEQIAARIGAVTPEQRNFAQQLARMVEERQAALRPPSPALPSTEIGMATTKTEVTDAEKRILEMQHERVGAPVAELPAATHEGGGTVPTHGMQLSKYPEEIQPLMQEIARANPDLAARTGPISHDQLVEAAQMIGRPVEKVAAQLAKHGVNSAELEMVRQGVALKVTRARELITKAMTGAGSPEDTLNALASLNEAATIQARLHEASSEAGRTLAVLRKQIDPELAANPSQLAYMAAISRIAKSPDHAQAIFQQLMAAGDDPTKVYGILRSLNKATFGDNILSAFNFPRAMKASFDISAAGRQGLLLSVAHPRDAARAFDAQLRAFRSQDFADAIDKAIRTSPMQSIRQKAGLYIADISATAQLSQREEAFLTNLAGRIPGYRASERAYVTYLNKLRADRFDEAVLGMQRAGINVTDEHAKLIAQWVNIASGRGEFAPWAANAAPLLNNIFFSPRFAVSRVQAATFAPTQLAKAGFHAARGDTTRAGAEVAVAKMAARDLASFVGSNVALLGMSKAAGAQIEMDPRSSEFGKIRVGGTVVDTWGGMQQIARTTAQFATEERKTVSGKNIGELVYNSRADTIGRFIESKLSPSTGMAWDLAKGATPKERAAAADAAPWDQPIGRDFLGQPFSAKDTVAGSGQSLVIPMSWSDVYDAIQADRAEGGSGIRGALLGSLSILGFGVTTYGAQEGDTAATDANAPATSGSRYHVAP